MSHHLFVHKVSKGGEVDDCPACAAAHPQPANNRGGRALLDLLRTMDPSAALLLAIESEEARLDAEEAACDLRVTRDGEAGATYVCLTGAEVARTVALSDSVNVDLDVNGNPVGVEVLHP